MKIINPIKSSFILIYTLIFFQPLTAQDFKGQWKGEFYDKSTSFIGWGGDRCDYVLELECKGKAVTGYSYTYFTDGGKKYYTICKLEGFIDRKQKYIEIKETERTKTNVPDNIRNCFQLHKLTYFKKDSSETIEGRWDPAPNQTGDCGYGTTSLTRRTLSRNFPNFNSAFKPRDKTLAISPRKGSPGLIEKKKDNLPVAKKQIPDKDNREIPYPKLTPEKNVPPLKTSPEVVKTIPEKIITPLQKFEKRNNTVLKTIEVVSKIVKVDLYDNGEVDGDSVSLFYNGKLLLPDKRLSEKPITLSLNVEDDKDNELIMYAENLGTISPNTALMIVTDGPNRYEVRITSDLQKSGVIHFIHKPSVADN